MTRTICSAMIIGVLVFSFVCPTDSHAGPREDAHAALQREDYRTAIPILEELTSGGDTRAQAVLAWMYGTGKGTKSDASRSSSMMFDAATKGDAYAQAFMGLALFSSGNSPAMAATWLRQAANQGLAIAQSTLGSLYSDGSGVPQDYLEAAKWFRQAAEQGDMVGQYGLADAYQTGHGVPNDVREAIIWYRRAADQGFAAAQSKLARAYLGGVDVLQDYSEASRWARRAAIQGDALGQMTLGAMYRLGLGVKRDDVQAYLWINLGVPSLDNDELRKSAISLREDIVRRLTQRQLSEAQKQAREFRPTLEAELNLWGSALNDTR